MTGQRIPYPFTGLSLASPGQWVRGEPLDDIKLHQRIDNPLETLGGIQRTWGADFAVFTAGVAQGTVLTANTNISVSVWIDTASGWDTVGGTHSYSVQQDGTYLVTASGAASPAPAGSPTLAVVTTPVGGTPDLRTGTQFAIALSGNNSGDWVSIIHRFAVGDIVAFQTTAAMTVRASQNTYLAIRQLSY